MNPTIVIFKAMFEVLKDDEMPGVLKSNVSRVLRMAKLYIVDPGSYHNARIENGSSVRALTFSKRS